MKRALEGDEDEGTLEEKKKVKFPVEAVDKYGPLPEALVNRLKESHDLYLSVNSDQKWSWADVESNLKELNLDLSKKEKDHLDHLIEANEKGPLSFPPALLTLYRDILKTRQKLIKPHIEKGEFHDDSTVDLLRIFEEEQKDEKVKFYISNQEVSHGFREIDYSVPYIFHLGTCFREFAASNEMVKSEKKEIEVVDKKEKPEAVEDVVDKENIKEKESESNEIPVSDTVPVVEPKEKAETVPDVEPSKEKDDAAPAIVPPAPAPLTPFKFATNIFENDEDEAPEPEEAEEEFAPRIVSTVGGVGMHSPETAEEQHSDSELRLNGHSPTAVGRVSSESKLKQVRAKISLDNLKQKLEFPDQKTAGNSRYVICTLCDREFPFDGLQSYRIHLLHDHKITMKTLPDTKRMPNANGRVGKVESMPPKYRKVEGAVVSSTEGFTPEWYRCKNCDELLKKDDLSDHRAMCAPAQTLEVAFAPVKIAEGKKGDLPLLCGLCEKSCDSAISLRQHLTVVHKDVASKILLEPDMRCGSCLTKFEDSVHLTLHCAACTNRKASGETMLELALGMLHCEICQVSHDSINETQDCYTNTQMIRCIICLNVVLSRGNFFHHMKTYHYRNTVGICCPFCELGEIPIRDCFIHIIDNHYNPILQLHRNRRGVGGISFDANNRIRVSNRPRVIQNRLSIGSPGGQVRIGVGSGQVNVVGTPLRNEVSRPVTATASRLLLPNLGQALLPQRTLNTPRLLTPIQPKLTNLGQALLQPKFAGQAIQPKIAGQAIQPKIAGHAIQPKTAGHLLQPKLVTAGGIGPALQPRFTNVGTTPTTMGISVAGTGQTQYVTLRSINPTQLAVSRSALTNVSPAMLSQARPIMIRSSQVRALRLTGAGASGSMQSGFIRPIQTSTGLQFVSSNNQMFRQVKPITASQATASTLRTLRPIRPATVLGTASTAASVMRISVAQPTTPSPTAAIVRRATGTIQAITPAQLQRARVPILQGKPIVAGTLVNITNPSNLNLLQK